MSTEDEETVRYGVLSPKAIWTAAVVILLVGVGVAVWLLLAYGGGNEQQRNQLEAIKTAGTIVVGTGGAAALLLAARRQRTAEITLKQKDREHAQQLAAARATEHDATQRRITELYAMAAGQLGSDKAAVRLAGLYALERLAQAEETQRQTIVNVICAYLRMPFVPPPSSRDTDSISADIADQRRQELQVRLTAQGILGDHLRVPLEYHDPRFWADIDLDLSEATLINFTLDHCLLRSCAMDNATFIGRVGFTNSRFDVAAKFGGAQFEGTASFDHATFVMGANFASARFADVTKFYSARFDGPVNFSEVQFDGAGHAKASRFRQALVQVDHQDLYHRVWPTGWTPDVAAEPFPVNGLRGRWVPLLYAPPEE